MRPAQCGEQPVPRPVRPERPTIALVDDLICEYLLGGRVLLGKSAVEIFKRENIQLGVVGEISVAYNDRLDAASSHTPTSRHR